uniref:RNA-binding protein MEX3B (Trinotate prediction) n=1 Tax=Henneguya salminicola TaxID=69463 RepID=A0A6G3MFF1_HENSL
MKIQQNDVINPYDNFDMIKDKFSCTMLKHVLEFENNDNATSISDVGIKDDQNKLYENENIESIIYEQKIFVLKNIISTSPYSFMSDLFKKVLMQIVMSFKFEEYDFVEVPLSTVGLVVGVKGASVKYIQDMTGTKIISPSRDMQPIFTIFGKLDEVKKAKNAISHYINTQVLARINKKKGSLGERFLEKFRKKNKICENYETTINQHFKYNTHKESTNTSESTSNYNWHTKKYSTSSDYTDIMRNQDIKLRASNRRCISAIENLHGCDKNMHHQCLLNGVIMEENKNKPPTLFANLSKIDSQNVSDDLNGSQTSSFEYNIEKEGAHE